MISRRDGEFWLKLDLNPEPWAVGPLGVKRGKGSQMIPYMGRNQQLHAYKEAIAEQAREQLAEIGGQYLFNAPTALTIYLWRHRAEYATPQSRTHRKHEADATNMLKATEDALQGIFYKNDKDNHDVRSVIVEQGPNVDPCIIVHIRYHNPAAYLEEIPHSLLTDRERSDQGMLFG